MQAFPKIEQCMPEPQGRPRETALSFVDRTSRSRETFAPRFIEQRFATSFAEREKNMREHFLPFNSAQ
jgi:hypothetical protein